MASMDSSSQRALTLSYNVPVIYIRILSKLDMGAQVRQESACVGTGANRRTMESLIKQAALFGWSYAR